MKLSGSPSECKDSRAVCLELVCLPSGGKINQLLNIQKYGEDKKKTSLFAW